MKKQLYRYMLTLIFLTILIVLFLVLSITFSIFNLEIKNELLNYKDFFVFIFPIFIIFIIAIIFLACKSLASSITKKILHPINTICIEDFSKNLDSLSKNIYEELSPFIKIISLQKNQIEEQSILLNQNSNIINIIVKNLKEGLILIDKKGIILSANKSAVMLFKNSFSDYSKKNFLELVREQNLQKSIKETLSGNVCDTFIKFEKKYIQAFLSPVFTDDQITGAIILLLDVSDKRNAEKMRREFSANVSHELKTPLTTISGYAEMITNDMVKYEDIKNISLKIKNESTRLISLINSIIKISRLDEGINTNDNENFYISEIVKNVIQSLKIEISNKNISIDVSGDSLLKSSNKHLIFEMIYNLIDNSIKYNKDNGSIKVIISSGNKTQIDIIDTGIGIEKKHLNRIFERFYRVDKSRSKKTGGSGLGLSIVKHIVEYFDGDVKIDSTKDEGTFIRITL